VHAIFFGLKRAYQSTLRLTRRCLAMLGLTAARFDMLYAVKSAPCGSDQVSLSRALGVTGATVSRMVSSLEDLGLVSRRSIPSDRRRRWVELTALGRQMMERVEDELVDSGDISFAIECALGSFSDDDWALLMAIEALDTPLHRIRHAFLDCGCLFYPWHPDD
jgi:DNA-binding MarR family transcriptional regulator